MLRKLILAVCFGCISLGSAVDIKASDQDHGDLKTLFARNIHTIEKYDALNPTLSKSRVRRGAESIQVDLEVNGGIHELNLVPSDRNVYSPDIPVWIVKHLPDKNPSYIYEPISKDKKTLNDDMYVDTEQMASIRVSRDSHDRKYFGVFGKGARKNFARNIRGKIRKGKSKTSSSKISINPIGHSTNLLGNADKLSPSKLLAKPLDTLYVEILPVVDYHLFKALGHDITETLKYVSAFWTEVDLMFSKIEAPKVRVVITGIVIAEDIMSLEYVYKSLHERQPNTANAIEMRELACKYFYRYFVRDTGFQNYDIAMIMTSLNTGLITGASDRGKVCDRIKNTGLVGDNAKFSGVHPATHEIGHFLNLPHDGHQDAENCDGYAIQDTMSVMAPVQRTVAEYYWSNCSKDILKNFSKLQKASCLSPP